MSNRNNFANGEDRGSAFAVYHKGELVVDLWGGFGNEWAGWPWRNNTVSKAFSSSKGVAAVVIAMLVER